MSARTWRIGALAVVVVAALVIGALSIFRGPGMRTVTADFERTVGLFEGSEVRVMGMRVGTVERITPHGTGVRVEMTYGDQYDLPRGVAAVVVAPSVISDRFVQLTPGYVEGPTLASGASIPRERTRTPVELDESLATTTDLMTALGPDGANRDGALNGFLDTMAGVLRGTGDDSRAALRDLATVSDTFATGSGDLKATLRQVDQLTRTLAREDASVRRFNDDLGSVAGTLAADREELSLLLATLARTLGEVAGFVRDNRGRLTRNVDQLAGVTGALAAERRALEEVADIAPLAFTNLTETYDAQAQAVRTRANFGEVVKIIDQVICDALVKQVGPTVRPACRQLHDRLTGGRR